MKICFENLNWTILIHDIWREKFILLGLYYYDENTDKVPGKFGNVFYISINYL